MTLVAGVDSSTQSCKVVVCDADTGQVVRHGTAPHPTGSEVDPEEWWTAFQGAIHSAGGLDDVEALSVGGQQHGMVCLDIDGQVVRPALLWNDTRSARAALELTQEAGDGDQARGAAVWAESVGSAPVASFTVTKLRWLAEQEPGNARRTSAVALPHDWLTWRISGAASLDSLVTDRSDASGTGYYDPRTNEYRRDLLALALRDEDLAARLVLPRILDPAQSAGRGETRSGYSHLLLGPGCGDNAGAALGLNLETGQTSVSIGTSGVVASVSQTPSHDPSGQVAGFADATGAYLPLACTLNGSRILDLTADLLGVNLQELSDLALSAPPGADGLTLVPYFEGERTPNLPTASGTLRGMTLASTTRANLARAAVEGLLCLLADAMDAIRSQGVSIEEVTLVGGGARSTAIQRLGPTVWGVPVRVPPPGEYVAIGAARQAAWTLAGTAKPPAWTLDDAHTFEPTTDDNVREAYRQATQIERGVWQRRNPT